MSCKMNKLSKHVAIHMHTRHEKLPSTLTAHIIQACCKLDTTCSLPQLCVNPFGHCLAISTLYPVYFTQTSGQLI